MPTRIPVTSSFVNGRTLQSILIPHINKANTFPQLMDRVNEIIDTLNLATNPTIQDLFIDANELADAVANGGGGGGGGNAYGTFVVAGQSSLVANATNSAITFVAGTGIVLTTNVASDGAMHLTVNGSALTVNNTTHAFGKLEGDLNVNSAATALATLLANNSLYFGGQLPSYYANVVNLTGVIAPANLPYASPTQDGIVSNTVQSLRGVKTWGDATVFNALVTANAALTVNGVSTLGGNVNITGFANVSSTLQVGGDVTITGIANASGNIHAGGNLVIDGLTTLTGNAILSGFANLASTLRVAGLTLFNGVVTANANVTVNGTLTLLKDINANGGFGTGTQVLASSGPGANVYWASVSGGGLVPDANSSASGLINTTAQIIAGNKTWLGLTTFTGGISANASNGNSAQVLSTNGSGGLYWQTVSQGPAIYDNGNSGATMTINWNNGNQQTVTMNATCTFTFTNPVVGGRYILIINTGISGFFITLPTTVQWPSQAVFTLTPFPNRKDFLAFFWDGVNYISSTNRNYLNT